MASRPVSSVSWPPSASVLEVQLYRGWPAEEELSLDLGKEPDTLILPSSKAQPAVLLLHARAKQTVRMG